MVIMMDQYNSSPKHSPHPHNHQGSRSPHVGVGSSGMQNQDGIKMTISLKSKTPFYLMKSEQTPSNEMTGATNLMAAKGLEHSYVKLTTKKMRDSLSSFLPNMPGMIDSPGGQDNSSLRGIIEKPPIVGKKLHPLNQLQLAGFRLHPGSLPEQYRGMLNVPSRPKSKKHKKHKSSKMNFDPNSSSFKSDSGNGLGFGSSSSGDRDRSSGDRGSSSRDGAADRGANGSGGGSDDHHRGHGDATSHSSSNHPSGSGGSGSGGASGAAPSSSSSKDDSERERRREKKHKRNHEKDNDESKMKKKKKEKKKKRKEEKD